MKKIFTYIFICLSVMAISSSVCALNIDEIKEKKEVTLKMVPPTTEMLVGSAYDLFNSMLPDYSFDNCNDDMTECDVTKYGEKIVTVKVTYEYDPAVKTVVDSMLKKLGDEEHTFFLNDVESINYFYANHNYIENHPEVVDDPYFDGFALTFPSFSSDVKKFFGYNNFEVRVGLGVDTMYYQAQGGGIEFWHNGTLYGIGPMTLVVNPYVVYIKEDATDIEKAIKDRLGKYFDVENVTKDTTLKVDELLEAAEVEFADYWDSEISNYEDQGGYESKEAYVEDMMNLEYYDDNAPAHYLVLAEEDRYLVEFEDGWATVLAVVRDDEKAKDSRELITNDVGTGVEVKTEGLIPLDTLIQVARITSGEDYDKIVKLLNVTNLEMFDLKLFSTSEDTYITKLENGSFEVKLPIKEELKGKDLIVYYVDNDDKIEEYKVTIDGDYAVFTTNHFSIYTLAEVVGEENPNTGDRIMLYVSIFGITAVALIAIIVYFVKKKK